ncbi:MAG: AsmA family protein, partial [Rhodospirillaceae bacterium]|nr:AsmA family protein [Rhodospirillaceae bacterium]
MNRYIKIIGGLAVFLIAIVVGTIAALKSMDINSFKNEIAAELKKETGRDVKISGDIELLISISPKLRVEDVSFANASWGSKPEMASIGLLEAKVGLLSLISGEINIKYLNISDMDLLLETNAQGAANWDFQPQNKTTPNEKNPSTGATQLPIVHDVGLRNVRVTYIDGVQKSKFSVAIPEMNLNAASGDEPVHVNVNAEINDAPLDVVATVGSLDQFSNIDEKPFPLSVAITASGLLAKIEGTVHIPKTGLKVGADVSLSGTEIET